MTISWVLVSGRHGREADVGFAEGGARVVVTTDKGGMGAGRFHLRRSAASARSAPVAAGHGCGRCGVHVSCDGAGTATAGAPFVGLFEEAVRYRVVETAAVSITTTTPAIAAHGGVVRFSAEVSAMGNRVFFGLRDAVDARRSHTRAHRAR